MHFMAAMQKEDRKHLSAHMERVFHTTNKKYIRREHIRGCVRFQLKVNSTNVSSTSHRQNIAAQHQTSISRAGLTSWQESDSHRALNLAPQLHI
mmetsp:Transcript_26242/g.43495  ORF Transcript_26242/g.43495 Transcript_26242/m.43495 type:complete len:94 (-) Transcript_26242:4173-4454(-)